MRRLTVALAACAIIAASMLLGSAFAADTETASSGGPVVIRRLSANQYRQIIADMFGRSIQIGGRFEPDIRENGLLSVGAGKVSVTATGLEQYESMARSIAAQVVDEQHRGVLIPCKPASITDPDDACAGQFIARVQRLLYRRTLTQPEIDARVQVAANGAIALKSFYAGIELSLIDMLMSPQFLFCYEVAEPDPDQPGRYRLDAFSKASQLSFLLWNAAPDEALLAAAEDGSLNTEKGLVRQVDRLLGSPRFEAGIRAFFVDMLGFDAFETLAKDAVIYPKFSADVAADAQEQTLRTIVDLLVTHTGDYRDLFTARKTFMTPLLGSVYRVVVPGNTPNGAPETWQPYEFAEGDPRAGLLSQISFVALHAHPGRSSATLRGKALRELLLCQTVPAPPGNVKFDVVQDTDNPTFKTARERLEAHRTNPTCAGCHKLIDPMGLALENFDGGGGYRLTENSAPIDSSGELDGVGFTNALGLGKAVRDNPAAPACLVGRLSSYALGRVPQKGEGDWIKTLTKNFAADGFRLPSLMRQLATSQEFYRVSAPQTGAAGGVQ